MATVTHKTTSDIGASSGNIVVRSADNTIAANNISEITSANGVSVDGVLLKDGSVSCTNSGAGICLPSSPDNIDINTIDCYFEGAIDASWTPLLSTDGQQWTTAPTYLSKGTYTKVGRLIQFHCLVSVSSIDNTGATGNSIRVSLPITPARYTPVQFYGERIAFSASWQWLSAYAGTDGYLMMLTQGNNLDAGLPPVSCLRNGSTMTFSGIYFT